MRIAASVFELNTATDLKEVQKQADLIGFRKAFCKRKIRWFGHLARMDDARLVKSVLSDSEVKSNYLKLFPGKSFSEAVAFAQHTETDNKISPNPEFSKYIKDFEVGYLYQ